jgi:O-antigen/teichoic acid export membrane protein
MIKQFIKDSGIYTFSTILGRGINIFLLPIYTRYLTTNEYGIIEILAITFTLLNLILPLEISQALARFVPDPKNKINKSSYATVAFWFTALAFGIGSLFVFWAPDFFANIILTGPGHKLIIKLAAIAMLLTALKNLIVNQLRINLQSMASAISSITYGLIMALMSVLLIVKFNYGVEGYIWGQITASALTLILGLFFSKKSIPISFHFEYGKLKEMLTFSAPLVLSSAAVYVNMFTDRWMLRYWLGLNEVGIYSVSYRVAALLGIILAPFQMSLTPIIYRQYKDKDTPATIDKLFKYFLIIIIPLTGLLGFFAKEIIRILSGTEYYSADRQVLLLSIATIMMFIYNFSPGLAIAKKTKLIAMINIITALVNIYLNFLFIPIYGRMGAATATLIASFISMIFYFPLSNKFYKISYSIKKYITLLIFLLIFVIIYYFIPLNFIHRIFLFILFSIISTLILADKNDYQRIIDVFF